MHKSTHDSVVETMYCHKGNEGSSPAHIRSASGGALFDSLLQYSNEEMHGVIQ